MHAAETDNGPNACVPRRLRRFRLRMLFDVDHLSRHAAVDDEIRPRDEAGALAIEQEGDDLGHVLRLPDAADGMLGVVLAAQLAVIRGLDPPGAHAIDAYV